MAKNTQYKVEDGKLRIDVTEEVLKTDLVSVDDLIAKKEALVFRRNMDSQSFTDALAKLDAQIAELDTSIQEAKKLGLNETPKEEPVIDVNDPKKP